MKKILRCIGSIISCTWKVLVTGTALISITLFFASCAMIFHLFAQPDRVQIEHGSALVLAPQGRILEKRSSLNPIANILHLLDGSLQTKELLLQDIIYGIRRAAKDDRIQLLVLAPDQMKQAGLNQLQDIRQAIDAFKKSGKRVIAYADSLSQSQYALAAQSDEVYLHPMGAVDLHGFGVFNLYMRALLDKLNVTFHIFRVGAFKSAVEPLLRNYM